VRWFHDPGVPTAAGAPTWRSLARRAFDAAAGGPVHLNLPFREPLVGAPGTLPPRRPVVSRVPPVPSEVADEVVALLDVARGVILAGGGSTATAEDTAALAAATGWPVLADATSGVRHLAAAVTTADALLRHAGFADAHRPDVVVRVGRPATSRVLAEWVAGSGAALVQVGGPGVVDPDHTAVGALDVAVLPALAKRLGRGREPDWSAGWGDANEGAEEAIDGVLDAQDALTEPDVARTIARHLPTDAHVVVAASMPMRDLEWYGGPAARAHANRGANGIDGVVSTALGVALDGGPVVALVGDVALVHDGGALTALARRGVDLRIVVVDNDGGGIFSFLPQAGLLPAERFEQLFGTPHGTDVVALAAAHGLDAATVTTRADLVARLTAPGPSLTRIATDRQANVAVHAALHAAIAATLA
jgi:2-succinyl-5-enolpyruvyl-6-hydroxy-3-cyclohexene-1-carboxylate synthase